MCVRSCKWRARVEKTVEALNRRAARETRVATRFARLACTATLLLSRPAIEGFLTLKSHAPTPIQSHEAAIHRPPLRQSFAASSDASHEIACDSRQSTRKTHLAFVLLWSPPVIYLADPTN